MHDAFDGDPVGALTVALRHALDAPHATWTDLLEMRAIEPVRADLLRIGDVAALDQLFVDLNELRTIGQ